MKGFYGRGIHSQDPRRQAVHLGQAVKRTEDLDFFPAERSKCERGFVPSFVDVLNQTGDEIMTTKGLSLLGFRET